MSDAPRDYDDLLGLTSMELLALLPELRVQAERTKSALQRLVDHAKGSMEDNLALAEQWGELLAKMDEGARSRATFAALRGRVRAELDRLADTSTSDQLIDKSFELCTELYRRIRLVEEELGRRGLLPTVD